MPKPARRTQQRPARPQAPRRRFPLPALVLLVAAAAGVYGFGLRDDAPGKRAVAAASRVATLGTGQARWVPPVRSSRWKCIVIHHSASEAGGAARFGEWHREQGWDELGYHFVVGNGTDTADGQVEVGPRWTAQKHGAHCRTDDGYYNQHGIGICLVGNFDRARPDEPQLRSLRRLVAFLCREYDIPPDRVYTHGGVTGQTQCPGKHFDLAALRKSVRRR